MKLNKTVSYTVKGKTGSLSGATSKTRVLGFAKHEFEKSGQIYLRVSYGKGIYNDGDFENYPECRQAIDQWTEKPLLEYIANGSW